MQMPLTSGSGFLDLWVFGFEIWIRGLMLRFLDGFFLDLGLWVARFVVVMATLVVDFLGPLPPTAMGLCLDWHIGV